MVHGGFGDANSELAGYITRELPSKLGEDPRQLYFGSLFRIYTVLAQDRLTLTVSFGGLALLRLIVKDLQNLPSSSEAGKTLSQKLVELVKLALNFSKLLETGQVLVYLALNVLKTKQAPQTVSPRMVWSIFFYSYGLYSGTFLT